MLSWMIPVLILTMLLLLFLAWLVKLLHLQSRDSIATMTKLLTSQQSSTEMRDRMMTQMVTTTSADMVDMVTKVTTKQNEFLETVTLGRVGETGVTMPSEESTQPEQPGPETFDGLPSHIVEAINREMEEESSQSHQFQTYPNPLEMQQNE